MTKFIQILVVAAAVVLCTTTAAPSQATISPDVQRTLKSKGTANIFVVMADNTSGVLSRFHQTSYGNRGQRLTSVTSALKTHASLSQASIISALSKFDSLKYESLWINNQIYVRDANSEIIQTIAGIEGVSEIIEETFAYLEKIPLATPEDSAASILAEEGVEKIQAPIVWDMPGGTRGEGIIVGEMTTGVRGTHEALRNNYVGDYGWYDPEGQTPVPNDPTSGLGTYSTGMLVGSGGIGVAPGAKWMACKGCGEFSCQISSLLLCGQFMACPTDPAGNNADCTKAPHVVVNNWGGGGSAWFDPVVDTWHAAGITPVFVVGINGPECGTAGAAENVVSVGAVHLNDTITQGSSRGPSQLGKIMPDLVAPGVGIRSASNGNDSDYRVISSTTPASNLVAGSVALIRALTPENIPFEDVRELLWAGAEIGSLTPSGGNCGGIDETIIPNNAYGYGRLNVYRSIMATQARRLRSE